MTHTRRNGATLMELLVAVAIVGVLLAVVGPGPRPTAASGTPDIASRVASARGHALRSGRPVTTVVDSNGHELTLYPDGSAAVDSLKVDPLTGAVRHAP